MRKILFILMMLLPVVAEAQMYRSNKAPKKKYSTSLISGNNEMELYKDSIVQFRLDMSFSLDFASLDLRNLTNHRIVVEWENMKINGSHIMFSDDIVLFKNRPKSDETLTSHAIIFKDLYKRSNSLRSIVDKSKLKKEGYQKLYFLVPIRSNGKVYDIETEWVVRKIK